MCIVPSDIEYTEGWNFIQDGMRIANILEGWEVVFAGEEKGEGRNDGKGICKGLCNIVRTPPSPPISEEGGLWKIKNGDGCIVQGQVF